MKNCLFFLLLLSLTALPESFAQTPTCSPKQDGDVISTLASAGTFANLANKKGSLKYELSSLVSEGLDKLEAQSSSPESPYLTLSVIPNKFKDDYSDIETCKRLENQTTKSPIHYKDINFKSKDELVEWFFDFTQQRIIQRILRY